MSEDGLTPTPEKSQPPAVPSPLAKSLPARLHGAAHDLLSLSAADRAKLFKAFNKTPPSELDVIEPGGGTVVRRSILEASMWQGPLPPPEHLEKFNQIVPGAADRIIAMAERQQAHRMTLETQTVNSQHTQSARGQIFGLCIGFGGIGLAGYLGHLGAFIAAGSVGGVTLGGLAIAFVTGKQMEKKSRQSKPQPPVAGR